jgi:hypothetical protein
MTGRNQFLLTVGISLPILAGAALLTWRRVAVELMASATAREFRRNFTNTPAGSEPAGGSVEGGSTLLTQAEWAWRFGGSAGLGRLQTLADDSSLTPQGRLLAAQVRDMIATGGHLSFLRGILDAKHGLRHDLEPPPWPTIALIEYIHQRDSRGQGGEPRD